MKDKTRKLFDDLIELAFENKRIAETPNDPSAVNTSLILGRARGYYLSAVMLHDVMGIECDVPSWTDLQSVCPVSSDNPTG